jgi:hypothetical protein
MKRGALVQMDDDELLAAWVEIETERNRLAHREHAVIAEIDARGIALTRAVPSTAALGSRLLRISPGEARARVRAAQNMGPRHGLTGEELQPIYAVVAAAQAEGAISPAHARVVMNAVETLPDAVRAEQEDKVESDLVRYARQFDPVALAKAARRISAILDPDGLLKDVDYRRRMRHLDFHRRPDGSAHVEGELDVECAEVLATVLNCLSAPKPAQDGTADPRTAGQRRHDALLDGLKMVLRARLMPTTAGVTTTVVVIADPDTLTTGTGLATTGTGALIPAAEACRWAGCDSRFYAALIDKAKIPIAYSTSQRLFSESQRIAMIARDRGCSFPGCDAPPAFTEAHHVTDYSITGSTTVADGCLLCGYHHREFHRTGWTCRMIDAIPHWVAPAWLDPDQTPVRNSAHHPTG